MWMSKKIGKEASTDKAEKGVVTLADKEFEAGSTVTRRNIESYSPYGYSAIPPINEEVMMLPSNEGVVCLGTLMKTKNLDSGEVKISSLGGATIILKNDGTISLNGLIISKRGVIQNG